MKYTKKQIEAIKSVCLNLDELENKPRRLYQSLINFAEAFDRKNTIPSLIEAEERYYEPYLYEGDFYLNKTLKEFKISEYKWWVNNHYDNKEKLDYVEHRISGAKSFIQEYIKQKNNLIY